MMKKVIDMCPFMGITWEDEKGNKYYKGDGLTVSEMQRLNGYFARYHGQPFDREKSIELAHMAVNNLKVPLGWRPKIIGKSKSKKVLKELYAFVADDKDGEGVMAMRRGQDWMPLIGADLERVKYLVPAAKEIARASRTKFRILLFNNREDITKQILKKLDNGP